MGTLDSQQFRQLTLQLLLPVVLLFLPGEIQAVFGGGEREADVSSTTQLVVKYQPGVVTYDGTRLRGTSSASADQLTVLRERYRVVDERPLLSNLAPKSATESEFGRVFVVKVSSQVGIEAVAAAFRRLDIVEYAQPDYPLDLYDAPDDPLYVHQWALNNTGQPHYEIERSGNHVLVTLSGVDDADIDALEVYENPPADLSTVVVAIVDTGVDPNHPDLVGSLWANPGEVADNGLDDDHNGVIDDVIGCDVLAGSGDPTDEHGHGTHCAGVVAAATGNGTGIAGICPSAKIMGVKCYPLTLSTAAEGVIYAVDNGADVINMSWGAGFQTDVVRDALLYARSRGVVLIASSGNDGKLQYNYPSSYREVISVGASTSSDLVASFSTFSDSVDICAPGQCVLSLRAEGTDMYALYGMPGVHIIDDFYYIASGTSMAGPHVVGVAAYLRSFSPGLAHDAIQSIIQSTADDFVDPRGTGASLPGWDLYSGYGRVNLQAAVESGLPAIRAVLSPLQRGAILSGMVDIFGSADGGDFSEYVLEYGAGNNPISWTEIRSSVSPVTDNSLGKWNTAGLDGPYVLRLSVGNVNQAYLPVYVINDAVAEITSPPAGGIVSGLVPVVGTAICPDFDYAVLEYGEGISPISWTEIATISAPRFQGKLISWNCVILLDGTHQLRLSVYSSTGPVATDMIEVYVEAPFSGLNGWNAPISGTPGFCPTYCDIDLDGANEIIVTTQTGVYFFNTDGSLQTTGVPILTSGDFRVAPAVGRLDNDQYDDIVFVRGDGMMFGFPTTDPPFEVLLANVPNMTFWHPGADKLAPRVFLKDMDGDGIDEIHYYPGGVDFPTYFPFNADGTPWVCGELPPIEYIACLPADLDGDGTQETYSFADGLVTGAELCEPAYVPGVLLIQQDYRLNASTGGMSVVDIDFDGKDELIVYGAFTTTLDASLGYHVYALDYVLDEGLVIKEGWPHKMGIPGWFSARSPVFGDINGDGSLEYVSGYSDSDNSFLYVWNLDGTPFLGDEGSSGEFVRLPNKGIANLPLLVDVDGDRRSDIVTGCNPDLGMPLPDYPFERIVGYNYQGDVLDGFPLVVADTDNWPPSHNPVFGDIDQDGHLDMAYTSAENTLVFVNFPDNQYLPGLAFCPMPLYNRRLNSTATFENMGDVDGDGVANAQDNCPYAYNPGQADADGDGTGDECECCTGTVGDANNSGEDVPTIGDIAIMVDAKFINSTCDGIITCLGEADVNQSGGLNPSCDDITIGDVSALVDYLFITGPEHATLPDCI